MNGTSVAGCIHPLNISGASLSGLSVEVVVYPWKYSLQI
ncbi:hypothetical protein SS05631_b56610 (plasmid) [Sinorhizobium sp. CCBAU 05631]|nr:hypothetical protein SS05631_b56610 [Sinorhizobium sp. CCBAU 05631]